MTSLQNRNFLTLLVLTFIAALAGCSTYPMPLPSNPNVVIVGIDVKELIPGNPPSRVSKVYFVKLEDGPSDTVMSGRILESFPWGLGYDFLINVQPGRYAAIGYYQQDSRYSGHNVFFTQSLIAQLTRTVAPGTVALLGDITVAITRLKRESDFDDVQQHNFMKIHKNDVRAALKHSTIFDTPYPMSDFSGSIDHESPLDTASNKFLSFLSKRFPQAWEPWINNSVVPKP